MRHKIGKALVWQFHAEIGTFHLSCEKYAVLPLDWKAILGIKFGGLSILTQEMSFDMACELLGILFPLTAETRDISGPLHFHRFALNGCRIVFLRMWCPSTFIFADSSYGSLVVASLAVPS